MRIEMNLVHLSAARNEAQKGRASLAGLASAGLLVLVTSTAASGQEGAGAQSGLGALEEIVVTAQKREENIQDVPISIVAFGEEQLQTIGATRLTDIENATPGLTFGSSSSTNRFVGIRGVGDFSRNIGKEARVGVYIDGVYQGRSYASDPDLLGVERVEVLRGPQGTLFGRNTVAGALNITTRKPSDTLGAEFQAEYGNLDYLRGAARVNLPIVANKAALAISVNHAERDGYVRNVFLQKDVNNLDTTSGRMTLKLDPSEQLEILLSGDYLDSDIDQAGSQSLTGPGRRDTYEVALNSDGFSKREIWGTSGTVNYSWSNDYTLTSITAYRDSSFATVNDEDLTPFFIAQSGLNESNTQFTQEVRLATNDTEKLSWVAGLFYIQQDIETNTNTVTGPLFPIVGPPGATQGQVTIPGKVKVDGMAGFIDGNYWLTESLQLNAGLRYTREEKEIRYSSFDGTGILTTIPLFLDDRSDSDLSPRLGLNYHLNEDAMLYMTAASASSSGGWNADFITTLDQIEFDAEDAVNVELGVKATLFDRRVRANLSVFHTRYDDFQVFQFVPTNVGTISTLTNAGKLTSKGAEAELVVRPIDSLTLTTTVAYTDAYFNEFKDGGGPGVDYDGNRPSLAPEWKAYAALEYAIPLGANNRLVAFADYSYTDSYFTNANERAVNTVPSYSLVSARLSYEIGSEWEVSLWGRNLADKEYTRFRTENFLRIPVESMDLPRTYGIRATVRF